MDFDKLFPARFLKAGEFEGKDVTLTIADVKTEELEGQTGKKVKAIVNFEPTAKGKVKELVLNRTNAECLKKMFGRDTKLWIGKRVTFYPRDIPDPFNDGEMMKAIRVKGSPDIAEDLAWGVTIGRKPANLRVVKTTAPGQKPASVPAQVQAPSASIPDAAEQAAIIADEKAGAA